LPSSGLSKSSFSFSLHSQKNDPDKAHDKLLSGVKINPAITVHKDALRKLRDAIEAAATFYNKYAEQRPGVGVLLIPEMAEWSQHEAFCASQATEKTLYRDAAQLAAIGNLMQAQRAEIMIDVVGALRERARLLNEHALGPLYEFELQVRDTSQAHEAAAKALKKAQTAKSPDKAASDAAQTALDESEVELARLERDAEPAAVQAAQAAQNEAENDICEAADALAASYRTFAHGAAAVMRGENPIEPYSPTVKRKAPKESFARFGEYVVQWTLAKRRSKGAVAMCEDFLRNSLGTMIAPAKEEKAIEALAGACEAAETITRLRAAPLSQGAHSAACDECRMAIRVLTTALGSFRVLLKKEVAAAEDFEKKEKALRSCTSRRDECEKEVKRLTEQLRGDETVNGRVSESKDPGLEKKRNDHTALVEEVKTRTKALEKAGKELETFANALATDGGERSISMLVAEPLSACVRSYAAFCATRVQVAESDAPPYAAPYKVSEDSTPPAVQLPKSPEISEVSEKSFSGSESSLSSPTRNSGALARARKANYRGTNRIQSAGSVDMSQCLIATSRPRFHSADDVAPPDSFPTPDGSVSII